MAAPDTICENQTRSIVGSFQENYTTLVLPLNWLFLLGSWIHKPCAVNFISLQGIDLEGKSFKTCTNCPSMVELDLFVLSVSIPGDANPHGSTL